MRKSGILFHISSLPNKYGIGTFGKEAYEFVDFLKKAGQAYWQVLPLGPTSYGDSPYQNFSAFAGNPYFIDFDLLENEGLLKKREYRKLATREMRVDYEKIYNTRFEVLKLAFNRFDCSDEEYLLFKKENEYWLDNYSLFMAIKNDQVPGNWLGWEEKYVKRDSEAIENFIKENEDNIEFYKFIQYEFTKQWNSLKKYANDNGILIIGDIPIYVAYDSSDVWSDPKSWQLNENLEPTFVAGCPPDAFSPEGQLWGNPLYNYELMEKNGYDWWVKRIGKAFELYDVVRIDHFRGFEAYYSIPYGDKNAVFGHWEKGPGMGLFNAVKEKLGDVDIIAEDLGFLTEEVHKLLADTGYPGMKIIEFAFDPNGDSDYMPHNMTSNCVVYPGTHDNLTLKAWLETLPEDVKKFCYDYVGIRNDKEAVDKLICCCLGCVSDKAIIQLTDYMNLGADARFNEPSTLGNHNWTWRISKRMLTDKLAKKIYDMNKLYRRV